MGLPYRFSVEYDLRREKVSAIAVPNLWIPMRLQDTTELGVAHVQNNWLSGDTACAVVFHSDVSMGSPIEQHNVDCWMIHMAHGANFDDDAADELALVYTHHDTIWLEVVDPVKELLHRMPIASGPDIDSSGSWDAIGFLRRHFDINRDGHVDLFVPTEVGYDLYGRALYAVDWVHDTILWQFDFAGSANPLEIAASGDQPEDTVLVLGFASKGNAAPIRNGMDDLHSYVVVLALDGSLQWLAQQGGLFTNCNPTLIDYDDDGIDEILTAYRHRVADASVDEQSSGTVIKVYELSGELIDSMWFAPDTTIRRCQAMDLDGDREKELVISFHDHSHLVATKQLEPIVIVHTATEMDIGKARDFLGNGEIQILMTLSDGGTYLVDTEWQPLACFPDRINAQSTFSFYDKEASQRKLGMYLSSGQRFTVAGFRANPWTSVFFRKPWLASLVVFLPMSLVLTLIVFFWWRIRRDHRVIDAQRRELADTLEQLRDTQAQLVAAEKFRTARDIAGAFAHEIRNSLLPVEIAHRKIKRGVTGDDSLKNSLGNADRAVQRALDLTNQISSYVLAEHDAVFEAIALERVVAEVLDDLRARVEEHQVAVKRSGANQLNVRFTTQQAQIVITNLLSNALDAVADVAAPEVTVELVVEEAFGVVRVCDNGSGIPEDLLPRVFDPFVSTKPKQGHGLGLALVKKMVEGAGGSVAARNLPDGGAELVARLPLAE